jgi:hypothetical protein
MRRQGARTPSIRARDCLLRLLATRRPAQHPQAQLFHSRAPIALQHRLAPASASSTVFPCTCSFVPRLLPSTGPLHVPFTPLSLSSTRRDSVTKRSPARSSSPSDRLKAVLVLHNLFRGQPSGVVGKRGQRGSPSWFSSFYIELSPARGLP